MYQASDGKGFSNRPPMRQHEKSLMSKSQAGRADMNSDPLAQPQDGGDEHTSAIHQHLSQMHEMTGHGHSHIEHKGDGSHMAHHVDHEGNVSGPEEHGDCPGGMCEGGKSDGMEPEYE